MRDSTAVATGDIKPAVIKVALNGVSAHQLRTNMGVGQLLCPVLAALLAALGFKGREDSLRSVFVPLMTFFVLATVWQY